MIRACFTVDNEAEEEIEYEAAGTVHYDRGCLYGPADNWREPEFVIEVYDIFKDGESVRKNDFARFENFAADALIQEWRQNK